MPLSSLKKAALMNIAVFVALSVLLAEILISFISILLQGRVTADYLITGGVVSLIVSGIIAGLIRHFSGLIGITGIKSSEERLAESEEQFRLIYERSPLGMAFTDAEGLITDCNDKFVEIAGSTRERLIGYNMKTGVRDERVKPAVDKAFSGTPALFEGDYVTATGSKKIVMRTIYTPLYTNSGTFRGIMLLTDDITERRRAEEALKEAEEKFRLFLEYCPVYVFFKDEDIRAIHLSRNFEKMLGRPVHEMLGKTMDELFPSDLAKGMIEDDRRTLLEGKPIEVEEEFKGRVYSTLKFPIFIEGNPRFLAGFTVDITDRKHLEKELRQQIERYNLVMAGVRDGIWDWDVPNKRVFFSPRWKAMRGFSEEEVSDREEEWSSSIHPEDAARVLAGVQAHFEGKTPWFTEEYRVRCKDGSWMWVLDRGIALRDTNGRVVRMAGSETDITRRKSMEEERERMIVELKEALAKVKTLSGLLPICAHCKKIRDDTGYWKQLEIYISDHSEAEFSHGICPDCIKNFYPGHYDRIIGQDSEQ